MQKKPFFWLTILFALNLLLAGVVWAAGGYNVSVRETSQSEPAPEKACEFSDVPVSHWAAGVIKGLCQREIVGGYSGAIFRPEKNITRAEFTKLLVKILSLSEERPAQPTFKDVAPGNWHYGVVEAAVKKGLVKGYENGEFWPDALITRQEMAVILARATGKENMAAARAQEKTTFTDDQEIASWARGVVVVIVKDGLMKGYPEGTFGPKNNATRAEACAIVQRIGRICSG